jgi:hypothetical protein
MEKSRVDPRRLPTPVIGAATVVLSAVGYYVWLRARFGTGYGLGCGPGLHHGKAGPVGLAIALCAAMVVPLLRSQYHSGSRLLAIAIGTFGIAGTVEIVEWLRVLGTHGCFS